jgi:Na+:H+ antiporter, NhaA family
MKINVSQLFNDFFESEKAGGIVLVFVTILSLFLANSDFQNQYLAFWEISFQDHSITHWINDGLMTIFFLLIGLELEREIYHGELSDLKTASLPFFGALGGMIVPAIFFLMFNYKTPTHLELESLWQPILLLQ